MMIRARSGRRPEPRAVPLLRAFRLAYAAAPMAVGAASALQVVLAVLDLAFAAKVETAGVFLLVVASMLAFVVALAARNEQTFLSSVVLISAASALADLPVHRGDAGVLAAVAGALVLCLIEAGGSALEPTGGGAQRGRPGRARVAWVTSVAVGGGGAGWLLLSLQSDLSDLGIVALAFGVLAAVSMILLTGALTGAALGDSAGPVGAAGGISPPGPQAPSRRDRRRARGTKSVRDARPPRSAPSS